MDIRKVTVVQYGGMIAEKILIEDRGDVLVVTTEEEWNASQRENRPPISVGFKAEYVVNRP
jgi:hypothetical protein